MDLSPSIWLAAGIILMALEIIVPGFVIFWFGLGGTLTSLLVFFGILKSAESQWLFFILSSMSFLALWFGYLKKKLSKGGRDEARDPTLVNLQGTCIKDISPSRPGEIELFDTFHGLRRWPAESVNVIHEGDMVSVIEASGIKLVVKKINPSREE
ncbi:MAG: NfeD family protein [Spirochaetes bacterium]|nr:NfeD family protein [Spirochaetota bacterium]